MTGPINNRYITGYVTPGCGTYMVSPLFLEYRDMKMKENLLLNKIIEEAKNDNQ